MGLAMNARADLTEGTLPDGSTWRVERIGHCSSLISRIVDGKTLWGQVFSRQDDHDGQVLDVLAKMETNPAGFYFWWNLTAEQEAATLGQLSLLETADVSA